MIGVMPSLYNFTNEQDATNTKEMCWWVTSKKKIVYKKPRTTMSQPHFEASVRMRLTLPKVGTWSPLRLPQLQSSIAEVKTPCLEVFFIPLERP